MKKILTFFLLALVAGSCMAMSRSKIRKHARFLTDRMAYELGLSNFQYDDCYEINYDFLYAVNSVQREMVHGVPSAIDFYYRCLDLRNEDLHYVLSNVQFARFMASEHFYRPICTSGSDWSLRIYTVYTDRHFLYDYTPVGYRSYRGEHSRIYYQGGFYASRYVDQPRYQGSIHLTGSQAFDTYRRSDFAAPARRQSSFSYDTYDAPNRNTRNQSYRQSGTRQSSTQNQRTQQSSQQRTQQGTRQGSTLSTTSRRGVSQPSQQTQRTQSQQTQPSTTTGTATSGRRGVTQTQSQQTQRNQQTQRTQQQSQRTQQQQSQPQQSTGTRQNGNTGTRGGRR